MVMCRCRCCAQAFKVSVSVDPQHGEALNNIAVLEMRRQKFDFAKSCFHTAAEVSAHAFEPFYNSALMAYRMVFIHSYIHTYIRICIHVA